VIRTRVFICVCLALAGTALPASSNEDAPPAFQLVEAQQRITSGDSAGAEKLGLSLLKGNAQNPEAHAILGLVHYHRARKNRFPAGVPVPEGHSPIAWDPKELATAEEQLKKAVDGNAAMAPAFEAYIDLLSTQSRFDELRRLVNEIPPDALTDANQAALDKTLVGIEQLDELAEEAAAIATVWVTRFPQDSRARRVAARTWIYGGRLDAASRHLSIWRTQEPHTSEFLRREAEYDIVSGNLKAATALLKTADEPALVQLRALLAAAEGDISAEPALEEIATRQTDEGGVATLARLLLGLFSSPPIAAGAVTEAANKLTARHAYLAAALALTARDRLGDPTDKEVLARALWLHGICAWEKEANLLRSIEGRVEKAGQTDNGVPLSEVLYLLGRALYHAHQYADAQKAFTRSQQAGKKDAQLLYHIARNLEALGQKGEATTALKQAAGSPGDPAYKDKAKELLDKKR
jgi:hypothetical protein